MGACWGSLTFPASTSDELGKAYRAYQQDEQDEYGTDSYNGTCSNCDSFRIYDQSFTSMEKAEDFLEQKVGKREAGAVKVLGFPAPKASDQKKIDGLLTKIKELDTEIGAFPAEIIKRVKAGKSKTRGCDCGSQIAVNRIKGLNCPVCYADFLTTDTDKKQILALREKMKKIQTDLADLKKGINEKATTNGWKWLVGYLAPE